MPMLACEVFVSSSWIVGVNLFGETSHHEIEAIGYDIGKLSDL